jgi:hypothetical protein
LTLRNKTGARVSVRGRSDAPLWLVATTATDYGCDERISIENMKMIMAEVYPPLRIRDEYRLTVNNPGLVRSAI